MLLQCAVWSRHRAGVRHCNNADLTNTDIGYQVILVRKATVIHVKRVVCELQQ